MGMDHDDPHDILLCCPGCKVVVPLNDYDCLGLDGDDLACSQCGHIGEMRSEFVRQLDMFAHKDDAASPPPRRRGGKKKK
jgi:hypothetical protein